MNKKTGVINDWHMLINNYQNAKRFGESLSCLENGKQNTELNLEK